jgi:DNA-3-methyladenine glycosylase I
MIKYHDDEWRSPVRDGRAMWEALVIDGFQAGLSWRTILYKRDAFRAAFKGFDPKVVAHFSEHDVERLMADMGIVRSHAKVRAAIGNAQAYLDMQERARTSRPWSGPCGRRADRGREERAHQPDIGIRTHLKGVEEARLQVRWPGDRPRLDAGGRHDQ